MAHPPERWQVLKLPRAPAYSELLARTAIHRHGERFTFTLFNRTASLETSIRTDRNANKSNAKFVLQTDANIVKHELSLTVSLTVTVR